MGRKARAAYKREVSKPELSLCSLCFCSFLEFLPWLLLVLECKVETEISVPFPKQLLVMLLITASENQTRIHKHFRLWDRKT